MEEFTQMLAEAMRQIKSPRVDPSSIIIPPFDPIQDDQGAAKWCEEVDKLRNTFNWSDHECLVRAATGLTGDAKDWYSAWKPEEKNWTNFRTELAELYPAKRNLSEKLKRASLFTSVNCTGYCEYARKKISLIKSLNFNLSNAQTIELVIGDIADVHVKTAAFNSNVKTIPELLDLLDNYKLEKKSFLLSSNQHKRSYPFNNKAESRVCFNCSKPGHISRDCAAKKQNLEIKEESKNNQPSTSGTSNICNFCKKIGHKEEKCFKKIRQLKSSASNINCFSLTLDN